MSAEQDNEIPKHKSKKNKRKWCKGKEGKVHKPVWEKNDKYSWSKSLWLVYRCTECGKELDSHLEAIWNKWDNGYETPEIGSTEPRKRKNNK